MAIRPLTAVLKATDIIRCGRRANVQCRVLCTPIPEKNTAAGVTMNGIIQDTIGLSGSKNCHVLLRSQAQNM